jgi:hypothetical protein
MADGLDITQDDLVPFQLINGIKNCWAGAAPGPGNPQDGMLWWDTVNSLLKIYEGGWTPLNFLNGECPVGGVIGWQGGYYTDGINGGYTRVLEAANTVVGANGYLNPKGYFVCDGAAPNDADSPIFNAAAKYLPNLTDDRFLMGDTSIAAVRIGGLNTMAHTHQVDITEFDSGGPSNTSSAAAGGVTTATDSHTHKVNPPSTTSGADPGTENRPKFLSAFYCVRIK